MEEILYKCVISVKSGKPEQGRRLLGTWLWVQQPPHRSEAYGGRRAPVRQRSPQGPMGRRWKAGRQERARGLLPREGRRARRPVGGLWVQAESTAGVRSTASLGQLCALEAAASACPGEEGWFGQVWAEKLGEGSIFTAEQQLNDEFLGVRGRVSSGSLGHWPEEGG